MNGISPGRAAVFIVVGWLGLVLCASLHSVLRVGRLPAPDVALIVVLFVGLTARGGVAGVCALAALLGYFGDLFAGSPKGAHMLAYALIGLAARGASVRLLVRGRVVTAVVSGLFAAVFGVLTVGLRAYFSPGVGWGALRDVPLATLSTAIFAPLVFLVLSRIDRVLTRDPRALAAAG